MHDTSTAAPVVGNVTDAPLPTPDDLVAEVARLRADYAALHEFLSSAQGEQVVADIAALGDVRRDVAELRGAVDAVRRACGLAGIEEAAHLVAALTHH